MAFVNGIRYGDACDMMMVNDDPSLSCSQRSILLRLLVFPRTIVEVSTLQ